LFVISRASASCDYLNLKGVEGKKKEKKTKNLQSFDKNNLVELKRHLLLLIQIGVLFDLFQISDLRLLNLFFDE